MLRETSGWWANVLMVVVTDALEAVAVLMYVVEAKSGIGTLICSNITCEGNFRSRRTGSTFALANMEIINVSNKVKVIVNVFMIFLRGLGSKKCPGKYVESPGR